MKLLSISQPPVSPAFLVSLLIYFYVSQLARFCLVPILQAF